MRRTTIAAAAITLAALLVPAAAPLARAGHDGNAATGTVAGTVTDELTGGPIEGACVWLWRVYEDGAPQPGPSIGNEAETGVDGRYAIDAEAGDYRLYFYDCRHPPRYASEYYDDAGWADATIVTVVAGSTFTADAALVPVGSISGTVTAASDGAGLEGVCVFAGSADPDGSGAFLIGPGSNQTDSDGHYALLGLTPGDYVVAFGDCAWGDEPLPYAAEYYPDANGRAGAAVVTVEPGSDTGGIDVALAPGGTVAGTVTNEAGEPLAGMCIGATKRGEAWVFSRETTTAADGSYEIPGLAEDEAVVRFGECQDPALYLTEWYDDAGSFDTADPVAIAAGATTSGIDAVLAEGATVSGTVVDADGGPADACVAAQDPVEGWWRSWTRTDAQGGYQLTGLATGDYKIQFSDCGGTGLETEWYDGAGSFEDADLVSVVAGAAVTGIDAALALRPLPDLAVTALEVTSESPSPPDDPHRRVEVTIANGGIGTDDGFSFVWLAICPSTVGRCRYDHHELHVLEPGETTTVSFPWTHETGAGTYQLYAEVIAWDDPDQSNNSRSVTHDVLAPLAGVGVRL